MTEEEIRAELIRRELARREAAKAPERQSSWLDPVRAALQGATFGFADEIGSAVLAPFAAAATDTSPIDAYKEMQAQMSQEQKAYAQDNSVTAGLLELAGGVATGGLTGAKALPGLLSRLPASTIGRVIGTSALGGAQGAVYGAGAAEQGERLEGAKTGGLIGAVAAPVAGIALEVAGNVLGAGAKWVGNKLAGTPRADAERAIRGIAERAGLSADDLLDAYRRLGPEAVIADTDESMRRLARAAADEAGGPVIRQARGLLEPRQMGASGRVAETLQDTLGIQADDFKTMISALKASQKAKADPLYAQARAEGNSALAQMRDDFMQANPDAKGWAWLGLGDRPSLESAIRVGVKSAKDMGEDPGDNLLSILDAAKQGLDRKIEAYITKGQNKSARPLIKLKNDLLTLLDDVSPSYRAARDAFAGDAALLDAAKKGRMFFELDPEDLRDISQAMSLSEREMLRRGAVKAIVDKLDDMSLTHDPSKIINKKSLLDRYESIFDSLDQAKRFINAALSEKEFARTRQVVTGGSPTSTYMKGSEGLDDAIQPQALLAFLSGQPAAGALAMARDVLGRKNLDPETLGEIGKILFTKGVPESEIRRILTQPPIARYVGLLGQAYPNAARGVGAPATVGLLQ